MRRPARSAAVCGVGLLWLLGCGGDPAELPAAPTQTRAVVVIEPPRILVGDVARVDVTVSTPPGHKLHPIVPPENLAGLWLLDAVAQPIERSESRWVHRTRIRVRAHEPGAAEWPRLVLEVEAPDGYKRELRTDPRPLEVVSVVGDYPEQMTPFSYRLPQPERGAVNPLAAAAAGALAMLAVVLLVAAVRRRRARFGSALEPAVRVVGAPWLEATAGLDAALEEVDRDWRLASHRGGQALKRYVTNRFALPVDCCTTEEAEALPPPFALASHWRAILDVLQHLDAQRFRPEGADTRQTREQVRAALVEARRLVSDTVPPEAER